MRQKVLPFAGWGLSGLVTGLLVYVCMKNGQRLQERRIESNTNQDSLRYGESLVNLPFRSFSGKPAPLKLAGKQVLLFFVKPSCSACEGEMSALASIQSHIKGLQIQPIIEGETTFDPTSSFGNLVGQFAPPVLDPDGALYRRCGNASIVPYAVLLDPNGRVRFATSGHKITSGTSTELTELLKTTFTGSQCFHTLTHWEKVARLSDSRFRLQDGKSTSFEQLSNDKVLVVTVLKDAGVLSRARVSTLEPFFSAPHLRFVFLATTPEAKSLIPAGMSTISPSARFMMQRTLGFQEDSTSQIIYRGRQLMTEGQEPSPELLSLFNQELYYVALLSESRWFRSQSSHAPQRVVNKTAFR